MLNQILFHSHILLHFLFKRSTWLKIHVIQALPEHQHPCHGCCCPGWSHPGSFILPFSCRSHHAFSCSPSSWPRSRSTLPRRRLPTAVWLMPPLPPRLNFRLTIVMGEKISPSPPPASLSTFAGWVGQGCQGLWWRPGHWHDHLPRPQVCRPCCWPHQHLRLN